MIKTIYVDMDGVLCDFRKQFISMFKDCPEIDYPSKGKEKKEYKRRFDEFIVGGHFATLEPMPDFDEAIHFLRSIEDDYTIKILSSTAQVKYLAEISRQKEIWLKEYKIDYPAIFVPGKILKQYYASPERLLIDDTLSTIIQWRDRYSPAIWHTSWEETIKQFPVYR